VLGSRLIPLALALTAFLVFLPALWNGFVEWDDPMNLYENPAYRGLTWPQIRWMFTSVLMGHWIPLTWLTFGLDYVLWEMKPVGLFALALVSKGSVMVLPLALVVMDFYPLLRLGGRWREWIRPPARAVWLEKIPFFVLGVAGGAITYYAQNSNSFITSLEQSPL